MTDKYNRVNILLWAPFSLLYFFVMIFLFLLIQDPLISKYVWSYSYDPLLWTTMVLNTPWSWAYLLPSFYGTLELFTVSCAVFYALGQWIPIPEDACLPDNRGIDTALNRFAGISLVVLACHFGFGFYNKGFLSGILLLATLCWGIWITLVPFEDSRSYSIAARCFPDEYDTVSVSDLKKLFNMWLRRMRQKKDSQESSSGGRSYHSESSGAHSRKRTDSDSDERHEGGKDYQQDSHSRSGYEKFEDGSQGGFSTVDSPWEVIGVEPGTPFKEVRKKWMELCKRYHPDLVPSGLKNETEEALKKVNVAYRQIRESMSKK